MSSSFSLESCLELSQLKIRPLESAPELWDEIIQSGVEVSTAYTRQIVEYQSQYAREKARQFIDLSGVLEHKGTPVGVWPLNIQQSEEGAWACTTNGGPVRPPIFRSGTGKSVVKEVTDQAIDGVEKLCQRLGIRSWKSYSVSPLAGIGFWHRRLMEKGAKCSVEHELYVNLSLSLESIRESVRSSYKSLINKGLKQWERQFHYGEVDGGVFAEFREFHQRISGRVTRSVETWNCQERAIREKAALLITLRDGEKRLVGGGLFHLSPTQAHYAVGVYDRELFDLPLGHVVQASAIEYLQSIKKRWYLVGLRLYPGDDPAPNPKELSICYFKEGFATDFFPALLTEVQVASMESENQRS